MSLPTGTRLGSFEILGALGVGGMGEVFRARDTKLNRDVALKVLPQALATNLDRLARFKREAQVLASLNHPNIAAIYGLEDAGLVHALVLELVEGPTLAEVIGSGFEARGSGQGSASSLSDSLHIARQIADALEAAHEAGIIHRDLKPSNVKVRDDGTVKVLDFGLAKALGADRPAEGTSAAADLANSPTLTSPAMTQLGVILGTAAYMSPEQARGREIDKRADIWAFGVVLYEMLTGRRPFEGEDIAGILAEVIKTEPDWTALPADTPPSVRLLLRRCLQKDRKQRLRDIGDARVLMDEALSEPAPPAATTKTWTGTVGWLVAAAATMALAALAIVHVRETPPEIPVVRSSVLLPDEASALTLEANIGGTAISPDGRLLAFVATVKDKPMLFVRPIDSLSARMLPGTEDAGRPFWSPDSRSIGFVSRGKLRRIGLSDTAPREICDVSLPRGATWNADGVILLSTARPAVIARVPAKGGTPVAITALNVEEKEQDHYWPQFLPDGRHFLFGVRSQQGDGVRTTVRMASLDDPPGGSSTVLVEGYGAVFAPDPADPRAGYLLFATGTSLMAQAFDPVSRTLGGEARQIAQDIGGTPSNAYVDLSVSRTGVLAYGNSTQGKVRPAWINPNGTYEPIAEAGTASQRLSPDGHRVVAIKLVVVGGAIASGPLGASGSRSDVILIDPSKPNDEPRALTFAGISRSPVWSPVGTEIVYSVYDKGLFRMSVRGGGDPQPLLSTEPLADPLDWSIDGKFLLYRVVSSDRRHYDVRAMPMGSATAAGQPFDYLKGLPPLTPSARFSPNKTGQRWVAYDLLDGVTRRVFVADFPDASRKTLVSGDGDVPAWGPDFKTLFFRRGGMLMAAAVTMTGGDIAFGAPKQVLEIPGQSPGRGVPTLDVGPDGRFLYTVTEVERSRLGDSITIVQNWQSELRR